MPFMMCGEWLKKTKSGSLTMRAQRMGAFRSQYPRSRMISGFMAATVRWQPMQNWTEGIPETGERLAPL
jgi:hypothetical protein